MVRIIHLSDFHLNKQNLKDWNSYLKPAMINLLINNEINFTDTYIVCTGDLIDKGGFDNLNINEAFAEFKQFVMDPLCESLSLPINRFLIVPGNHDIERNADDEPTELGYKAYFDKDYKNISKYMIDVLDNGKREGIKRIIPFKAFENSLYLDSPEIFKSIFGTALKYVKNNSDSVGIVCLNSSWRAYDNNDANKLIIGEEQLLRCNKFISECSVKIALSHHPLDWLLPIEKGIISSHVYKDFNLLLVGHVHESSTTTQTGFNGSIFINISPSCTSEIRNEGKAFSNGITIINYDKSNQEVDCKYFKYNHESKAFTLNTDLVPNGRFVQKIPAPNSADIKYLIERSLEKIKKEHYPVMDDHIITQKAHVTKSIKEAFIMPPIADGEILEGSKDTIVSLNEIVRCNDNFMFFGYQEIGKTTLLFRLVYEFVDEYVQLKKIPIYFDFEEIRNKEIITVIKEYLLCGTEDVKKLLSEKVVLLLIDNLDYTELNVEKIKKLQTFLNENPDVHIIATAKNDIAGIAPTNYFDRNKIPFRNYFIKPFTTKQIKGLMKIWVPNEDPLKFDDRLDKMVNNFSSYSLPCTAMSVSLFLWSTENNDRKPINQALLLDIYIEIILEKLTKENIYTSSFDYMNKTMLLAKIAKTMSKSTLPNCAISHSDYEKIIEEYIRDEVGFDYDAQSISQYFIDRKIFIKTYDNKIRFLYSCFFHFFLAKRMENDIEFKEYVTQENNYHNFHKEIDYYSGLVRNDKNLLLTIFNRFKHNFDGVEFIFNEINIDKFFTIVRQDKTVHESSSQKIDLKAIKSNRPSENAIETFYDKKLAANLKDNISLNNGGFMTMEQLIVMLCNVLRNSDGVEDLQLKKEIYNSIIHYSVAWVVLYKELLVSRIIENKELPSSIPSNINLEYLLKFLPFHLQLGLVNNLGTYKLTPIILEKIKQDIKNDKCSDVEAYLSVALYADEHGRDFPKYFKKLIKRLSNSIVRDYCESKLTHYFYRRTKEGSSNEEVYIDLLTELRIRSQKLSRRITETVRKSISDGKKFFNTRK